jgi:uncharacterized protein YndB with AHSA1/START domain
MDKNKTISRAAKKNKQKEILITRILDAPRELVWKAWTEPERLKRWWGPKIFTSPFSKIDLRVGGRYLFCMRSPDGKDFWSTGVYREIVEPERIVYTDSFADEKGNPVPASHYGMSGEWQRELLVTVTFEEHESKTKLTLQHIGIPAGENRKLAQQGWNESFDKLEESLKGEIVKTKTKIIAEPGKQEIIISREFDAPRELVFKAFTDPKFYIHWLGPRELTMTIEKFELRNGGSWRYIHKDIDGNEYAFHGVIHEFTPPERIIDTFEFEGLPEKGHVILETVRFEELPGNRTKLTSQSVFQSVADRDGMLQSGMERGVNDSYQRLDELLAKMKLGEEF